MCFKSTPGSPTRWKCPENLKRNQESILLRHLNHLPNGVQEIANLSLFPLQKKVEVKPQMLENNLENMTGIMLYLCLFHVIICRR